MKPITRMRRARCGALRVAAMVLGSWALVDSTACASAAVAPPKTTTNVDFAHISGPRVEATAAGDAIATPMSIPTIAPADAVAARPYAPPVDVSYVGTDMQVVLSDVAKQYGLDLRVDPSVHASVTVHDKGATLSQVLNDVVTSAGYAYQLNGPTLVVGPIQLEHKDFQFNYVAMTRIASGNTSTQRQLGGAIGGTSLSGTTGGLTTAGTGGLGGGGGDIIQSYSDADVWNELQVALRTILAPSAALPATGAALTTPATQTQTPQVGAGGSAGTPSYSQTWADGTSLVISPVAGLVSVTAAPEKMARVGEWIALDLASIRRQVVIEAKIVEVDFADSTQTGINWGIAAAKANSILSSTNNPSGLATGGTCGGILCYTLSGNTSIGAVITALQQQGKVSVLSDPRVSTLQNQAATFNVTTDANFFATSNIPITNSTTGGVVSFSQNVTVNQIQVGIVLQVTPQVAPDGTITMSIRPAVTSLDGVDTFNAPGGGSATAPRTSHREVDAMAIARNGETILMGGLSQSRVDAEVGGVPGLMNLPGWLGKVFTTKKNVVTRSELVIFLTPTIMTGQSPAGGH